MSQNGQFSLLGKRRFLPYFLTQALGAFNDNLYKNALLLLITFGGISAQSDSALLTNLAAGLFILPFFAMSEVLHLFCHSHKQNQTTIEFEFEHFLLKKHISFYILVYII